MFGRNWTHMAGVKGKWRPFVDATRIHIFIKAGNFLARLNNCRLHSQVTRCIQTRISAGFWGCFRIRGFRKFTSCWVLVLVLIWRAYEPQKWHNWPIACCRVQRKTVLRYFVFSLTFLLQVPFSSTPPPPSCQSEIHFFCYQSPLPQPY